MRKCDPRYENPIDNVLIDMCDWLCPHLYSLDFTPNIITTIGTLIGLWSLYSLWQGKLLSFIVLYSLSYFFDVLDGHYSRKYCMETEIGDYYDHIRDNIMIIMLLVVVYCRYRNKLPGYVLLTSLCIMVFYSVILIMYTGCLDRVEHPYRPHSDTLNWCKKLCFVKDPEGFIKYARHFGYATNIIVIILLITFMELCTKSKF